MYITTGKKTKYEKAVKFGGEAQIIEPTTPSRHFSPEKLPEIDESEKASPIPVAKVGRRKIIDSREMQRNQHMKTSQDQ